MDFRLSAIFVNLSLFLFDPAAHPPIQDHERALVADREPLRGRLTLDSMRRFVFQTSEGEALPVEFIQKLENPLAPERFGGSSPAHRLDLWGDEFLSGSIQRIDERSVRLLSDDDRLLEVPIALVARIEHSQGHALVLREDFESAESIGSVAGRAERSAARAASGTHSLRLAHAGDQWEYRFPAALAAGWLEVQFYDPGTVAAAPLWSCVLDFDSRAGAKSLRVELGFSSESYGLATPQGPAFPVQRIARRPGWNRLGILFSPERTTVLIDDAVLGDRDVGLGALRALRFTLQAGSEPEPNAAPAPDTAAFLDDLQLKRAVASDSAHQAARSQDDVLLANGDQLFGRIRSGDARQVVLDGEFGSHGVPWPQVHQIHLAPRELAAPWVAGQRARVAFASNAFPTPGSAELDRLEGVLEDLTADTLTMRHPHIGAVRIQRARIREIEFFGSGRWLALDSRFHHFGDAVDTRFQFPFPTGTDRSWEFSLDSRPVRATLTLSVIGMEAAGAGGNPEKRLESDAWRTFATLNGNKLDPNGLNHLVPARSRGPVRLALPIDPESLRIGNNVLRIYQTAEKDDPRSFNDCGIFGIGIELHGK